METRRELDLPFAIVKAVIYRRNAEVCSEVQRNRCNNAARPDYVRTDVIGGISLLKHLRAVKNVEPFSDQFQIVAFGKIESLRYSHICIEYAGQTISISRIERESTISVTAVQIADKRIKRFA